MTKSLEDQMTLSLVDNALGLAFGSEWINLERGRLEVMRDFIETSNAEGISASEYRDRIWRGNLQSYADCLLVKV